MQSWPGEAAWLDGSSSVTGLDRVRRPLARRRLDHEVRRLADLHRGAAGQHRGELGLRQPEHPMAAHPDQIWIDGVAQRQVGSLAEVVPGTFFHDEAGEPAVARIRPTGHDGAGERPGPAR